LYLNGFVYGRDIANTDIYWSPTKLANTFGNLVRAAINEKGN
jgi:hypothetical protein